MKSVPYETAGSGKARDEIVRLLQGFGASSVGFMDEFDKHEVVLAFVYRGRNVQLRASAEGWAQMYLRAKPWSTRRAVDKKAYEKRALDQGMWAVNSILRDWVKGQVTAIECGILSFEAVFLPYMLTQDGRTVAEIAADPESGLLQLEGPR